MTEKKWKGKALKLSTETRGTRGDANDMQEEFVRNWETFAETLKEQDEDYRRDFIERANQIVGG